MTNSIPPSSSIALSSSTTTATTATTISDLPQPVLLHILSLLHLPEATQTSLISRHFLNLWHSLPSLHFSIFDFYNRSTLLDDRTDQSRRRFSDFVSQTLNIRHLNSLNKLHLRFEYEFPELEEHKFNVYSWIRYAINSSVSELILDFIEEDKTYHWKNPYIHDLDDPFDFHILDIGKSSSIQVLKLYNCCVHLPPKTNPIKFVSLKSLELGLRVTVSDDDHLEKLLERCVNLEILKLIDLEFEEPGVLRFYSTSLKELYVKSCTTGGQSLYLDWDICCPSLQKISLMCSEVGKYTIKHTTMLVEASVDFLPYFITEKWEKILGCFTNISTLDPWAELLESNEVPAGCEQFASNVKHLELYFSYNENDLVVLAALLKLLPKLEILGIRNSIRIHENLHGLYSKTSTVFNMPSLRKVILRSYKNTKRERHFIELFKKNGVDKIVLLR